MPDTLTLTVQPGLHYSPARRILFFFFFCNTRLFFRGMHSVHFTEDLNCTCPSLEGQHLSAVFRYIFCVNMFFFPFLPWSIPLHFEEFCSLDFLTASALFPAPGNGIKQCCVKFTKASPKHCSPNEFSSAFMSARPFLVNVLQVGILLLIWRLFLCEAWRNPRSQAYMSGIKNDTFNLWTWWTCGRQSACLFWRMEKGMNGTSKSWMNHWISCLVQLKNAYTLLKWAVREGLFFSFSQLILHNTLSVPYIKETTRLCDIYLPCLDDLPLSQGTSYDITNGILVYWHKAVPVIHPVLDHWRHRY